MKSITESTENLFSGRISTSSIRNFLSSKHNNKRLNPKSSRFFNSENTPPPDPNIQFDDPPLSSSLPKPSLSKSFTSLNDTAVSVPQDLPVKVVVRIRPGNEHERQGGVTVRKVSSDLLSVGDRNFGFDSVLDSSSNQEDLFQLVGIPLVKSALAGYNTSILSYGQTGSGKTYTLWGPPSAMVEDPSPSSHQGLVPRIFQMLFSDIQREQESSDRKQINYQCRCSFLEVYNDQIGDLLDPVQRNLEIRDDPKNGLHVENLTEEYVSSYEDVTQILIKGLSNKKVGATSINSKSSRSHVVFTFIIESWCKGTSSKCFSSSRISRISFVDLAGLDRTKLDDAGRQFVREGKNIKKSLSQLGRMVNALGNGTQPGKFEVAPYKGSCLTYLLQESLGGNSKLTVICNISPENRYNGETLRTLRFGQRVKSIKNEPVINEISEDDVNDLSDQIRQLKEELIRAKSDVHNSVGNKNRYFKGRNARESLNHLRVSLNRSLILPRIDNDSDNEVEVDEDDVKELHQQLKKLHSSCEENLKDLSDTRNSSHFASVDESFETDSMSEDEVNGPGEIQKEGEDEEINLGIHKESEEDLLSTSKADSASSLSISLCRQSPVLQEPTLSESPKIGNTRRSIAISSAFSASQDGVSQSANFKSEVFQSLKQSEHIRSSLRSSKLFLGPTESLAASLQRGLQIIDHHQQNSASNRSSVAFSFEHLALKPCAEVDRAYASIQKLAEDAPSSDGSSAYVLCASCKQKINNKSDEVQDSLKTWTLTVDEAGNSSKLTDQAAKDEDNGLKEAHRKENELENVCKEQAARIEQLNRLVEQYKLEKELSIKEHDQEVDVLCLEGSKDQIISRNEEYHSLKEENEVKIIKEVQEELDHGNLFFDMKEKEALLQEIQSLRAQLKSYTDASANKSINKLRSSLLAQSIQLRKSLDARCGNDEELEREKQRWTEMESEWISITDDLRIDLESNRRRAEKVEMELILEKKCTEELDDALSRAVLGHARMVEHYADLQEKYNDLLGKHRAIMEGIAEVKKAAAKAGTKGGTRFAKSLAAELSVLRVEREREREFLKKENKNLKIQLRDTAEAVHAAGELLVRLREAEHAASDAEEKFTKVQQDNEKLKKQMEKNKRKHKMEMITMKQYLAESRLPESALQPLYREDSAENTITDDDQAWRAEFGPIYQEHF
ncbi:Chromosome-associated kinesin KIF4A, putative [Ricinus communis]|uniref:Chromosome-associated kinesin KIF4A, putative n=1 Tax=Ricinus communis TaxID=3988 RepID=B9SSS1_RICCO|nr:Chromosome-associated kinesin KIF4A, putative [Ricinus communis]